MTSSGDVRKLEQFPRRPANDHIDRRQKGRGGKSVGFFPRLQGQERGNPRIETSCGALHVTQKRFLLSHETAAASWSAVTLAPLSQAGGCAPSCNAMRRPPAQPKRRRAARRTPRRCRACRWGPGPRRCGAWRGPWEPPETAPNGFLQISKASDMHPAYQMPRMIERFGSMNHPPSWSKSPHPLTEGRSSGILAEI